MGTRGLSAADRWTPGRGHDDRRLRLIDCDRFDRLGSEPWRRLDPLERLDVLDRGLDALDRGAVDYLAKPDYGVKTRTALQDELPRKIRMAAGCDVRRIVEIRRGQRQ